MQRFALSSALGLVLLAALACATVRVTGPDKQDAGTTAPCANQPQVLCEAGPPTASGCTADPDGGYAASVPPDASYPVGCVVDFPDPHPLKETGECILVAQCTCVDPSREAGAPWHCTP